MDIKDSINQLSDRVLRLKEKISTEEATKNAFIMPFIQILGYDVFNPIEVVPEMDCDLTKKKGEKIDYAIFKDNEPIMLIECKHWKQELTLHDNQLQKYFVASKAKFGVLTNGIKYRFYTDLTKSNIMDDVPFLELDLENLRDNQIEEVKKFHKSYFNIETILSSANELKYTSELKTIVHREFTTPSPEFVKLIAKQVYDGILTQKMLDQFTELTKKSISTYINDIFSDRLKIAIKNSENQQAAKVIEEPVIDKQFDGVSKTDTTKIEIEGYYVVKSIIRNKIKADRITYRDAQTYFAILIDDNNRKPVCRLYFNNEENLQIALIDENKKEIKTKLSEIDDIFSLSQQLLNIVDKYVEIE
ncbi:MAG: type I restriction endonuclease [Bacteroidales bacterium]|nr:type I restriction endonuclease [Bacteroidales bacterium]